MKEWRNEGRKRMRSYFEHSNTHVILSLGRQKQENCSEFKASLVYILNF